MPGTLVCLNPHPPSLCLLTFVGIGKTSLIKSIVQVCEDIVHVDPVPTNTALGARHGTSSRRAGDAESTGKISEVYASTRPYPHWWSEIDESKVLRRRKSRGGMDEQVIERNLTFVDTPGYGSGTSVGPPFCYTTGTWFLLTLATVP